MIRAWVILLVLFRPLVLFAGDTELNLYRPFAEGAKHVPVTIESHLKGDCFHASEKMTREDAWQCIDEHSVTYDPCFSKRFGSKRRVVCPQSPWSGQAIEIQLQTPLDDSQQRPLDMSRTWPWAIELITGERCMSSGSMGSVEDEMVHYQCQNGIILLGNIHRCAPVWTILRKDVSGVSLVDVSKAWF